jgi:hypothetical protein
MRFLNLLVRVCMSPHPHLPSIPVEPTISEQKLQDSLGVFVGRLGSMCVAAAEKFLVWRAALEHSISRKTCESRIDDPVLEERPRVTICIAPAATVGLGHAELGSLARCRSILDSGQGQETDSVIRVVKNPSFYLAEFPCLLANMSDLRTHLLEESPAEAHAEPNALRSSVPQNRKRIVRRRDRTENLNDSWRLKMLTEKSMNKFMSMFIMSFLYFIAEMGIGAYSGSLALIADAFHILTDVVALSIGYYAAKVRTDPLR